MDLTVLLEKKKTYMQAVKDEGTALLKAEFVKFFEANPDVQAVRWRQYTPYFNDGDACVFGRHEFETRPNADTDFGTAWDHEYVGQEKKRPAGYDWQKQQTAADVIQSALGSGELDDVFLSAFGDHVEVIATRAEFLVEEYSHD